MSTVTTTFTHLPPPARNMDSPSPFSFMVVYIALFLLLCALFWAQIDIEIKISRCKTSRAYYQNDAVLFQESE